jgi:quercetin dioxygenase-like cupin family protein
MAESQSDSYQRRGATTGSPQRPAERLAGPVLAFDLEREVEQLRQEPAYQQGTRNADTLVHQPDFRIVLVALKSGGRLQDHEAEGRVAIQALAGRLRLQLPDRTVELPAGHLLALEAGIAHDVEALEESAFLLTIAWPAGQGSRA